MIIAERIPDRVALPLLLAMESHQGMTKGQISEARATLHRLCAFKVKPDLDDAGEVKRDKKDRPLAKTVVEAYRVHPDDMTKNEKRLLPLLLDFAKRDFAHDPEQRVMAQTPAQIEQRAQSAKLAEEKATRLAQSVAFDESVRKAVDVATADLNAKLARMEAMLDKLAPTPSALATESHSPTVNP